MTASVPAQFVHLHLHSEFSLADGLIRIEPSASRSDSRGQSLTARLAELGLPACAITDRCNLFAMVKFYKAAEAAGIKPVIGCDLYFDATVAGEAPECLTFLVQNEAGYRNLTRLVSRAYLDGQSRGQPLLQRDWLTHCHDGTIVLAGLDSAIGRSLVGGRAERAEEDLNWWTALLGDRFYLEIGRCGRAGEATHLEAAVALASRAGVPVVATNDVRFLRREDFGAHEARVCIHQGRVLDDPRRPRDYTPEQYLKDASIMCALFADLPQSIENTLEIARRCTLCLEFGTYHLPVFPVDEGVSVIGHLRTKAREGLAGRLARTSPVKPEQVYRERLEYELEIIEKMGFPGYFLVVADFIGWSKSHGVPVGPGRGSGAGSLVAYAIGITDLDPLPYDLLFERFLNPERVSMPDFDVDFCMEGRDRVIDYVASRYGRDRVGQIITYGSMAARAVVRDVARVLGYPYAVGDRIAKLIPGQPAFKNDAATAGCSALEYAFKQVPEFRQHCETDDEARAVLELALNLEDITRGVGVHAGGVVIAPEPLTGYAPLYCEPGGSGLRTQFDMKDLETVGLVKFDFLGLRTLTIIDWAVKTINARRPGLDLEVLRLPMDDPQTYTLYASGFTTAVFQMEGQGMQRASVDLRPDRFEDIIALISLYRPGPMDLIPEYVARKRGKKPEYLHPDMEPVLAPTYGVFVYQEQVMQIAQRLAGYTLGGADLLRRAMGKKKPAEMAKQRSVFLAGAAENGIQETTANAIFDLMEKFAGYGFNKSHAAAYALVSYQTAWLKTHYPAEFMAAVLSAEMSHTDTVVVMLDECARMGIEVLPPDVNASMYRFTVPADGQVRYGLGAIKGAGEGAMASLVAEREAHGPFADLFDLCRRIDTHRTNKRVLEALARSGALDGLGLNRASLLATLPRAVQFAEQSATDTEAGQSDLFGLSSPSAASGSQVKAIIEPDWPTRILLTHEKDVLGLYFSGHPIEEYRDLIRQVCGDDLKTAIQRHGDGDGGYGRGRRDSVLLGAWLVDVRSVGNGRPGRILVFDDRHAQLPCWVDIDEWQRFQGVLRKDQLVFVEGEILLLKREGREPEHRIRARRFFDIDGVCRNWLSGLRLRLRESALDVAGLQACLSPWRAADGVPVTIELTMTADCGTVAAEVALSEDWRVRLNEAALVALCNRYGADAIRPHYRRYESQQGSSRVSVATAESDA